MTDRWRDAGFGLYIHWPFCMAKCPYCDFNSHVWSHIDQDQWTRAYVSEIKRTGVETQGRLLRSVFFGGGTPSLMSEQTVATILDTIRDTWTLANDVEVTLEANPTSVEASRFQGYHDAGVNRVSLGLQALNDPDLKRLGRLHSVEEGLRALDIARNTFDRVSFDLIYARQDQTLADWQTELTRALSLGTDHLSLYQLTIEDGTAFGDRFKVGGLKGLPPEDTSADMYDLTQALCADAGLPAYEVSNHACPDQPSRHNLIYWTGGDYAGIGPGAHGRLTLNGQRVATETPLAPAHWLDMVQSSGTGEGARTPLSLSEVAEEALMMGLRITGGIAHDIVAPILDETRLSQMKASGLIERSDTRLRLTPAGRPLLNEILRQIVV